MVNIFFKNRIFESAFLLLDFTLHDDKFLNEVFITISRARGYIRMHSKSLVRSILDISIVLLTVYA